MARLSPELAPDAHVLDLMRQLQLLILDVDGVLTDGRLYYGADGTELKAFNALDGSAMKRLMAAGVAIAIVSGRTSAALERRARELAFRTSTLAWRTKRRCLKTCVLQAESRLIEWPTWATTCLISPCSSA